MLKLKNIPSLYGIAIAFLLLVSANIISQYVFKPLRIDITRDQRYTLSPETHAVLSSLDEKVSLRLFYSRQLARELPIFRVYAERILGLLEEYERASQGKIRFSVIDLVPFSIEEEEAIQYNLQGVPLDQVSGQRAYLGLIGTNSVDDVQTIPFFHEEREPFLEYDLTKMVYHLSDPARPVIGVVGSVPWQSGQSDAILRRLQDVFEVRILSEEEIAVGIDSEITVLMVARPQGMNPRSLYAIDQFVLSGKRALILVDPYVETVPAGPSALLPELFAVWGVESEATRSIADSELALSAFSDSLERLVPYPNWLRLSPPQMNSDDVVTASLQRLHFASSGSLARDPSMEIDFTPLLSSSSQAYVIDVAALAGITDPTHLLSALKGETQSRVLAARISGSFQTAFPDGPPEAEDPFSEDHRTQSALPVTTLILVADTDFLDNGFWVSEQDFFGQRLYVPVADNAAFIINALDTLSGSEDLIALRRGNRTIAPFLKIQELRRQAARQYLTQEQELQEQLRRTEQEIAALERPSQSPMSETLMSSAEVSALENFQTQALELRRQLRSVQYNLNKDIEELSGRLKLINIALAPSVIALAAFVVFLFQRSRYSRARRRWGV